jgi:hypothetical protein
MPTASSIASPTGPIAPDLCDSDECLDEVLVRALKQDLDAVTGDTMIVLHQMGNHGPAYFQRYPSAFRRFTPDCATAELRNCSADQVVNAYDNAILYTDHVLAEVIRLLSSEVGALRHGLPVRVRPWRVARRVRHVPARTALCHRARSADACADDRVDVARLCDGNEPHGR